MEILNLFRVFGADAILEIVAVDEVEALKIAVEDSSLDPLQIEYMQQTPHLEDPGVYGEITL